MPYRKLSDLPATAPLFPLNGVLLLPRGQLPLNIFEPRYLNMIDDAMAGDRVIAVLQTQGGEKAKPALAAVGCLGRITAFAETQDGRYLITLTGVHRFRTGAELPAAAPYRQARLDFAPFDGDLQPADDAQADREALMSALRTYLDRRSLDLDWETAQAAPRRGAGEQPLHGPALRAGGAAGAAGSARSRRPRGGFGGAPADRRCRGRGRRQPLDAVEHAA